MQLDIIGTLAASALFVIGHTLKFPVEASILWVLVASFAWVRVRERWQRDVALNKLQERIDALWPI